MFAINSSLFLIHTATVFRLLPERRKSPRSVGFAMATSAVRPLVVSSRGGAAAPSAITILIGVTHPQTCLILHGRLRALRKAGFHVMLVSSPGPLLDETA